MRAPQQTPTPIARIIVTVLALLGTLLVTDRPPTMALAAGGPLAVLVGDYALGHPEGGPAVPSRYTLSLIDGSGRIVAGASAANRSSKPVFDAAPLPLPPVSASRSYLYFLDGDSTLKRLSATGAVSTIARLPGSRTAQVTFAVSPDDSRIAVGVIRYDPHPGSPQGGPNPNAIYSAQIYVQDLRGGRRVEVFSSTRVFEWPVAWRAGHLVIAVGRYLPGTQQGVVFALVPNPLLAGAGYHVANAATGNRIAALCPAIRDDGLAVFGLPVPAGVLCLRGYSEGKASIAAWSGQERSLPGASLHDVYAAALAPNGMRYAYLQPAGAGGDRVVVRSAITGADTIIGVYGEPAGWLDGDHLLVVPNATKGVVPSVKDAGTFQMVDMRSGAATPIGLHASYGAMLGTLPTAIE